MFLVCAYTYMPSSVESNMNKKNEDNFSSAKFIYCHVTYVSYYVIQNILGNLEVVDVLLVMMGDKKLKNKFFGANHMLTHYKKRAIRVSFELHTIYITSYHPTSSEAVKTRYSGNCDEIVVFRSF